MKAMTLMGSQEEGYSCTMSVGERLGLGGRCCNSYCESILMDEGVAHAGTWAWPCWDKGMVCLVLAIGDSEM